MLTGLPFAIFSFKYPLLSPLSTLFTLSSVPFQSLLTSVGAAASFRKASWLPVPPQILPSCPLIGFGAIYQGYSRDLGICFSWALQVTHCSAQFAVPSLASEAMASVEGSLWSLLGRMESVLRLPGGKAMLPCLLFAGVCDLRLQMWLLRATLFLVWSLCGLGIA